MSKIPSKTLSPFFLCEVAAQRDGLQSTTPISCIDCYVTLFNFSLFLPIKNIIQTHTSKLLYICNAPDSLIQYTTLHKMAFQTGLSSSFLESHLHVTPVNVVSQNVTQNGNGIQNSASLSPVFPGYYADLAPCRSCSRLVRYFLHSHMLQFQTFTK